MGETRTDAFWELYREKYKPTEAEIEKTRTRLENSPLGDDASKYFIHEAVNATHVLLALNREHLPISPEEYQKQRERLLRVRAGLDWFIQPGPIPKQTIIDFLDRAEARSWNLKSVKTLSRGLRRIENKFYPPDK